MPRSKHGNSSRTLEEEIKQLYSARDWKNLLERSGVLNKKIQKKGPGIFTSILMQGL